MLIHACIYQASITTGNKSTLQSYEEDNDDNDGLYTVLYSDGIVIT